MRILFASLLLLSLAGPASAADDPCFPPKPADTRYHVYEFVDLLNAEEQRALDEKLQRFSRETSNQIVVVVVGDLCGEEPAMFGQHLLEAWGIGQKGKDNGVVVLVKPTQTNGRRELFIATGYGMEGAIPDATAKQIVEDQMLPLFKQERYAEGLERGTDTMIALAKGEYNEPYKGTDRFKWIGPAAIILIFLLVILIKRGQVRGYARRNRIGFWEAWWLLNAASSSHGGRWGGFTGGGGGGWSGGGGFGGGSGGGGGAGGSW
jgi:uncharacterized protein